MLASLSLVHLQTVNLVPLLCVCLCPLVWACVKRKLVGSGESSLVGQWEQKVSGGLRRFYSGWLTVSLPFFCLFFWYVGWGERSHRPVLGPLQGSSLNVIYICDANHSDTIAEQRVFFSQAKVQYTPMITTSGLLKMILKDLVGILKYCC